MIDNNRWYFRDGARLSGPHGREQILALYKSGALTANSKIFLTGKEHEGQKLSSVFPLSQAFKSEQTQLDETDNQNGDSTDTTEGTLSAPVSGATLSEASHVDVSSTSHSLGTFHPWRRYFARGLDLFSTSILLTPFLKVLDPSSETSMVGDSSTSTLSTWYTASLWGTVLFNSLWISRFGTTPGKWVLGIRVLNQERQPLLFKHAFSREVIIVLLGFGGGFLFLSPLFIGGTLWFMKVQRATPWDRFALASSEFEPISFWRVLLCLPILLACSAVVNGVARLFFN